MKRLVLALAFVCASLAVSAKASDPSGCPIGSNGGTVTGASGQVEVTIFSMKLNDDMDPDFVVYTDHSDLYGKVTINADGMPETFDLPEKENTENAVWNKTFTSRPATVGNKVHITVHLAEDDWGLTGGDDYVDVSPAAHDDLELDFDTCSMRITGDLNMSAVGPFPVTGGASDHQGVLRMQIAMADGRALSPVNVGDVVLQDFDLIQVVPSATRLVAGKPSVAKVTIANNTLIPQPVSVHLLASTSTQILFDSTVDVGTLDVGEVLTTYLPDITPTNSICRDTILYARADLVLQPGAEPSGDPKVSCWLINDSSDYRQFTVTKTIAPDLTWVRVASLITATDFATMPQLHAIHDAAMPFIRAVYPVASIDDSVSTIPWIPPVSGAVLDLIATIVDGLGLPADYVIPYTMVIELDADAFTLGIDRIMGALPRNFFGTTLYGLWSGHTGLSLGTTMPRAVIFESETSDPGDNGGPMYTLPAHELGHTYGLSTDPNIKHWFCGNFGILGEIACAAAGGYDEYTDDSPEVMKLGVPTSGYWIAQDTVTGSEGQRCPGRCMMGDTPENTYNGNGYGVWVDGADYDKLIDGLTCAGKPTASARLYVSGAIANDDTMALGWTLLQTTTTVADFPTKAGTDATAYTVDLLDAKGNVLSESQLPLSWNVSDIDVPLPLTLFGGAIDWVDGTATIQVRSRISGKTLGERAVSATAPTVGKIGTSTHVGTDKHRYLDLAWDASDADKDPLVHFVHISPDQGKHWWPVAHGVSDPKFSADITDVAKGSYLVRVLTSDGVHLTTSSAQAVAL